MTDTSPFSADASSESSPVVIERHYTQVGGGVGFWGIAWAVAVGVVVLVPVLSALIFLLVAAVGAVFGVSVFSFVFGD